LDQPAGARRRRSIRSASRGLARTVSPRISGPARPEPNRRSFVQQLNEAGYKNLTVDQVIELAYSGVQAEDLKIAKEFKSDIIVEEIALLKRSGAL
jgi:hypothetical protein